MDISDAYKVLNECYSKYDLRNLYREKGLDNSETDTIRKHLYHAQLLRDCAKNFYNNVEKRNRLDKAADTFQELYYKESCNR